MKKHLFLFVLFFLLTSRVQADYVLPYPSYMPGNKLYNVSRTIDTLKQWWHWGSIASFKYHMGLSGKYLVEAKTLFEYRQYPLALDALDRSSKQFQTLPLLIEKAKQEGKETGWLRTQALEAVVVQIELLEKLENQLPKEFLWTPEKAKPTDLHIASLLTHAIGVRQNVASKLK